MLRTKHINCCVQTILMCIGFDSIVDFSKRVPFDTVIQRISDNIDTLIQYVPLHKVHYDAKNRSTFDILNTKWEPERILKYINVPLQKEFGITLVKDRHTNKRDENIILRSAVLTPFHYNFELLEIFGFCDITVISAITEGEEVTDAICIQIE